jgi:predicted nuclease of restriction endonuclease-like (RecB) superfamily
MVPAAWQYVQRVNVFVLLMHPAYFPAMNFPALLQTIQQTHTALQQQAAKAINRALTIRNWLIGYYIVEFEQQGEDRAAYGEKLLRTLAHALEAQGHKGLSFTNLNLFRQFYLLYPQMIQTVSEFLRNSNASIDQAVSEQLPMPDFQSAAIPGMVPREVNVTRFNAENTVQVPPEKLLNNLSFSHFTELLKIDDPLKRTYYELLAIKGTLSVRDLKRQISTLSYERTGLSKDKEQSLENVLQQVLPQQPAQAVKDLYVFEFLELPNLSTIEEKDLESALLNHLQQFMLELGHGFCFEARQQKILIGGEYFFIDLVFYHRILKCHVLVELKVDAFNHANAGQLNTYLSYYKKEVAQPGDNPPVGILLVTDKNKALVEYATAGMDAKLFVSQYLVQLPSKEQLQQFVQTELRQLG